MDSEEEEQPQEKSNPFRRLPMPKQPQPEKNKSQNKAQGKEITITLKPWKLVRGILVLVVLLGVFFAGRLSAGEGSVLPDFSTYFSSDTGPSGLATGDAKEAEEQEADKEEIQEEAPVKENVTEVQLTGSEEVAPEVVEEVKDEGPENVIYEDYSKVTLSLDGVYKDWKGTWGKIKGVKYTITNNEAGTIKPHHFSMIVEGYEDGEKLFDVSYTSQKVKAGQTISDEAAVTGGFSYSPVTIPDGDLTKVRISLFLLDVGSETIASAHKEVDLSGN